MEKRFYITTPLYYVNASPHIGHSYTNIAADCLARRYRQFLGEENVWLLTGTDEHGQKIQKAANEQGLTPQEFTDKMVKQFEGLWKKLNISYNDFIRTTEPRHVRFVQQVLDILHAKGDIYSSKYEGWYCTPCETFWTEQQLADGMCPDCKRAVEKISELNYFFKLSRYQSWLIEHIEKNPEFIRPRIRNNEVLSFLKLNTLTDLCISRPKERLSWGIPVPFSPDHVTYVWFDALINYISAVGEFDANGTYTSKWWPADVHLIGKDILRQHAIIWPIMLRALGVECPRSVFAHGWWLIGESKMSKSRGNVVSPLDMIDKYGIDVYRYFLLREVPFGLDGNFSENALINRFNSDLANDLGNLVYRTLTMAEKYFQGAIPPAERVAGEREKAIENKMSALADEMNGALTASSDFNFSVALEKAWELINMANKYVEDTKPWNLAKENKTEELESFVHLLIQVIRTVKDSIKPFMPRTAGLIESQIGADKVTKGSPLFPRIE